MGLWRLFERIIKSVPMARFLNFFCLSTPSFSCTKLAQKSCERSRKNGHGHDNKAQSIGHFHSYLLNGRHLYIVFRCDSARRENNLGVGYCLVYGNVFCGRDYLSNLYNLSRPIVGYLPSHSCTRR